MSARLVRRIKRDFPAPDSADEVAAIAASAGDSERIQASVIIWGTGDLAKIHDARSLALTDWRDVLVRAGLAVVTREVVDGVAA